MTLLICPNREICLEKDCRHSEPHILTDYSDCTFRCPGYNDSGCIEYLEVNNKDDRNSK